MHGPAHVVDLSAGGCFVEWLASNSPVGLVRLHVTLPLVGELWLNGLVVHLHPARGFGLRFVELTEEHRAALTQAVTYLRGDRHRPTVD